MSENTPRQVLHRLLGQGLIEVREAIVEERMDKAFKLTDLLHNLPFALERAARGEVSYEQVLSELRQRAQDKKVSSWLEHTLAQFADEGVIAAATH